jgi:hypothetical protein
VFAATVCLTPTMASGQRTEVTPFLGALLPLSDNIVEDEFESKHASGFGAGVRLAHRFAGRIGVEGSLAYASSDVDVDDDGFAISFGGNLLLISGKVLYDLSAPASGMRIHVGAGPAIIMRGGDFYDELELSGTTDVGVVIGAGVRVPVGERLALSIQLEDHISSLVVQEGSQKSQSRRQNDVLLSIGLAIPLGASR